jgi:hypothetical protein
MAITAKQPGQRGSNRRYAFCFQWGNKSVADPLTGGTGGGFGGNGSGGGTGHGGVGVGGDGFSGMELWLENRIYCSRLP